MTRARDIADSGVVINVLDGVTSNIQTQFGSIAPARYSSPTITTNTTLDADTHYLVGKAAIINTGVTMTIPADTLLEIKLYTTERLYR